MRYTLSLAFVVSAATNNPFTCCLCAEVDGNTTLLACSLERQLCVCSPATKRYLLSRPRCLCLVSFRMLLSCFIINTTETPDRPPAMRWSGRGSAAHSITTTRGRGQTQTQRRQATQPQKASTYFQVSPRRGYFVCVFTKGLYQYKRKRRRGAGRAASIKKCSPQLSRVIITTGIVSLLPVPRVPQKLCRAVYRPLLCRRRSQKFSTE